MFVSCLKEDGNDAMLVIARPLGREYTVSIYCVNRVSPC